VVSKVKAGTEQEFYVGVILHKILLIYQEIKLSIAQFWRYLFAADTVLLGVKFLVQE
jgi:hypothetical protein